MPGTQPTVEKIALRGHPELRQALARGEPGVEVEERLAHAHEDDVIDRLPAAEVERLVEDLGRLRLRANRMRPVAQKVHVSGHPDWLDRHTERRPSR